MFRALSLTTRLTLFFTLVAAALVLGMTVLFMGASERHFQELDHIALRDKQRLIESILNDARSAGDARQRLGEALSHHHGLYVLVKGADGDSLYTTEGLEPPGNLLAATSSEGLPIFQEWNSGRRRLHGLFARAGAAYAPRLMLNLVVAIDTEHHTQFMAELQRTLALYAVLALLLSALLSWLAAHQGLAPLHAIKARAAVVSGLRLEARMPVEAVPIEMASLAQELNGMLDRLQDDFRRLSDFSSDLAHELRTPISNLLTQTQVTLSAKRDAGTYREILASNAEELQRLARMVSDMLFLAKTERGVELPNKERFSAAHEIQALMDFYEAVAEERGIVLSRHGNAEIHADRLMFRRAVSNLLSNALRHSTVPGAVTILVEETPEGPVVTVENTGENIDPKLMPRLFDRFFRSGGAKTYRESDGAGLGLAITQAIVEAHGGTVTVTSTRGRTKFSLQWLS